LIKYMRCSLTFPIARLLALAAIAVAITGSAIYWVNASASRHHRDAALHEAP
jgi:hypothetical protein